MKKTDAVSWGLVVLGTILAITAIAPLFKSGIPMNIDQPCHYLREWCVATVDSGIPNNWCNFWQAGVPISQYYFPLIDLIISLLSKVIGLTLAYKAALVLTLLMPAIGAFILLKSLGHPLAAGIAFLLLAVHPGSWHFGGFEETLLVGLWPYVLSTGFWLIGIAGFLKFLSAPSNKTVLLAAVPTLFMTHPMTLVFGAISYTVLAAVHYKTLLRHKALTVKLVMLVILLNAYYIIPLLVKKSLFPNAIGGGMDAGLWSAYIGSKIGWLLWILAAAGLVFMHPQLRILSLTVLVWTILNFILPSPFRDFTIGVRFGAFIAPVIFMSAAVALERIARVRVRISSKSVSLIALSLILCAMLAFPAFKTTKALGQSILLSDQTDFAPQHDAFRYLKDKEGRVLAEETLYNANSPLAFTHAHCLLPIESDKELVGSGLILFPRGEDAMGVSVSSVPKNIFHKPMDYYTKEEVLSILQQYNMKWVLVNTNVYNEYFRKIAVSEHGGPGWNVLEMPINATWVDAPGLRNLQYTGLRAEFDVTARNATFALLKTHYYPNWIAWVDEQKADVQNCNALVCVPISEGTHHVIIEFRTRWFEYLGYLLSVAGIVLLVLVGNRKL